MRLYQKRQNYYRLFWSCLALTKKMLLFSTTGNHRFNHCNTLFMPSIKLPFLKEKKPSELYGSEIWEPFTIQANYQFEKFLYKNNSKKYEKKRDSIHQKYGIDEKHIGAKILDFIGEKINSGTPFSIIRVNDGEGTLLFGELFNEYNKGVLDSYITRRISYIIFGSHSIIPDNLDTFRDLLKSSINNADILGIPEQSFIRRKLDEEKKSRVDVRAVLGSYSQVCYIYEQQKANKIYSKLITSAWLSFHLLPHYKSIFQKFKHIAIITGNKGLGDKIKKHFLLRDVIEIIIPTQRSMLNKSEELHWPDRYHDVLKDIDNLPENTLVLVAAGILGKPYCTAVKLSGNSAIDIGHVADIWDGKTTTRPGSRNLEKWIL